MGSPPHDSRALAANVTLFVAAHQHRFRESVNTEFARLNSTKVVDEVVLRTEILIRAARHLDFTLKSILGDTMTRQENDILLSR